MAPGCYHCGLPVPEGSTWQVRVDDSPRAVCCPGCQMVAEAILGAGLDSYYKHRSELPPAPPKPAADLAFFDRDEVQADCVCSLESGLKEARLSIGGIRCAACVWLIEQRLARLPGVHSASLNLGEHSALVQWDPHQLNLSSIAAAIREVGYEAFPHKPDAAAEARERESRDALRRMGVAGIGMMQVGMAAWGIWVGEFTAHEQVYRDLINWASFLVATLVVGYCAQPFFRAAWASLRSGKLGMDVPVTLAIVTTFIASLVAILNGEEHVYFDSVTMFVFLLLLGRYLEMQARHTAFRAISAGEGALPLQAHRLLADNEATEQVPVVSLLRGDRLLVKAGEVVPADGRILSGSSSLNEAALTGEFFPVPRKPGERVVGGTLNIEQPLVVEVEAVGPGSRLATIQRLLARANAGKPAIAILADRIATQFTLWLLVITALTTAGWWWFASGERALWVAVAMLAITCPCALSLATPTALTASLAALRKRGFLVTQPHALEAMAEITRVVLDKTGTLTEGKLWLEHSVAGLSATDEAIAIAAALEAKSEHPIARAFLEAHAGPRFSASSVQVHPGLGLSGQVHGTEYRLGSPAFALPGSTTCPPSTSGHWLLLTSTRGIEAWFLVDDRVRDSASQSVQAFKQQGLKPTLLSGDASDAAARVAASLGIDEVYSGCSPEDKLARVRQWQAAGERVLMVGDGINDAPVLAGADVSVAMGSASDLAKLSADCALLGGQLDAVASAVQHARRTRRIIRQNLAWALAYNLVAIPLAAAELVSPYVATLGMSLSSILVVLNAVRLTRL